MTTLTIYITGGGKGAYRFCSTTCNTGLLTIGNACGDLECHKTYEVNKMQIII